jgi:hypothetical protein
MAMQKYIDWKRKFHDEMTEAEWDALNSLVAAGCEPEFLRKALFAFSAKEHYPQIAFEAVRGRMASRIPELESLIEQLKAAAETAEKLHKGFWRDLISDERGEPIYVWLKERATILEDMLGQWRRVVQRKYSFKPLPLALLATHLTSNGIGGYYPKLAVLMRPAFAAHPTKKPDYDASTLNRLVDRLRANLPPGWFDEVARELGITLSDNSELPSRHVLASWVDWQYK